MPPSPKSETNEIQAAQAVDPAAICSPTWREEIQEARELVLRCARQHGIKDAKEGTTIPPVEFCEDTKSSKMLREAWLEGWYSANDLSADTARK